MTRYRSPIYFIISLQFLLVVLLAGCATTKPNSGQVFNNENPFKPQLKTQKSRSTPSLSKAPDTKSLPEITPKEIEQAADLMFLRGNLPMAFVKYDECLKSDPENLNVHYKKGLVLLAAGMNQDAIREFERIIEKNKSFVLAHEGLGKAYFQMRQHSEAEKHFLKALEMDSNLWRSHNFLGIIYDYHERYDEAALNYLAAIRLEPSFGVLYHNLGVSYYLAGHYQKAVESFQKAIGYDYTESKTYNTLALAYAKVGKYPEALDAFTKGGDKAKAYNNLGCFFLAEKKYTEAINCFEKAMATSPKFYTRANENLSIAQIALHRDS